MPTLRLNPTVSAFETIDRRDYPGVFLDYDRDGVLNVDDPRPLTPGDDDTVEEVRLSDEIAALIELRNDYTEVLAEVMADPQVKASKKLIGDPLPDPHWPPRQNGAVRCFPSVLSQTGIAKQHPAPLSGPLAPRGHGPRPAVRALGPQGEQVRGRRRGHRRAYQRRAHRPPSRAPTTIVAARPARRRARKPP